MTKIGQASLGENGKISGGIAGDNTGKEVYISNYKVHSKGWRVLRAQNDAVAKGIAVAMEAACNNDLIGYDQIQRNTLYDLIVDDKFDPSKADQPCETDCSALVRVCILYALRKNGISNLIEEFYTGNQASILLKTKLFTEMLGDIYTTQPDYLKRGDILVTKTKGHTVVVLDDGDSISLGKDIQDTYALGERELKNGSEGRDVQQLQTHLIELGFECGKWGADGDFGDLTEVALKGLQKYLNYLGNIGVYDLKTHELLMNKLGEQEVTDSMSKGTKRVKIVGGNCYIREEPNKSAKELGIAKLGTEYELLKQSDTGWIEIDIGLESKTGWVSGKYAELIGIAHDISDSSMVISSNGIKLISEFEGCYLEAYLCPAKVWTIGIGTTIYPNGIKVKDGDTCTLEQANEYLAHDMKEFEKTINNFVKVDLTQNQFDALVSLSYNIGSNAFKNSTLLKKLNNKDYQGAADQILVWNRGDGKVLKGLVRRREAERALFLKK